MDTLLIDEVATELSAAQRKQAIDQLLELDIDALAEATGRTFTDTEREEIRTHQRRAYR
jgi:hypothetical protein